MKKLIFSVVFLTCFIPSVFSQDVKVYETFDELQKEILKISDERIHVVNFWATWCGPCVAELPYFESLGAEVNKKDVEIVLVSIDFASELDRKVKPFIIRKGLKNKVVLLDDPKANDWIDRVDPSWTGSIPITLFISKDRVQFYEKEYHTYDELLTDLNKFKNNK